MSPLSSGLGNGDDCSPSRTIQVLACGNVLRGDDGVGWHIAAQLNADPPCEGFGVTFAPQLLPEHAELVGAADQVIFIDCSALTPPGTVSAMAVEPAIKPAITFSHHLDPPALLRLAQELYARSPVGAMLITIGGESFALNQGLSETVAAAIPEALDAVRFYTMASTRPYPI